MKRFRLEGPQPQVHAVVTVGSFDGLHIGHQAVVERLKALAAVREGTSVVVTFDPHPRRVISPETAPLLLTSLDEKSAAFERMEVDVLAVVPFTDAVRRLSPAEFVDRYLVDGLNAETVVLGYDHGFGRDRSGDLETMSSLGESRGFDVVSVPPTLLDGSPVSSTRVRQHVERGEMEAASRLLGDGYPVTGTVERGDGRGRTIGFPTANLSVDLFKLLPPDGVYAGVVRGGACDGKRIVVNLGTRPTFDGGTRRLEAHLLDYEGDLYGRTLSIALETKLRDERKFDGVNALKSQIRKDIEAARRRLDEIGVRMDVHNRRTDGG